MANNGLLGREDADAVALIETALRMDGVRLLTQTDAVRCECEAGEQHLIVRHKTELKMRFLLMPCCAQ